jgi:hypothetical protein
MHVNQDKLIVIAFSSLPLWMGSILAILVLDVSMIGNIVTRVPQPDNPIQLITTSLVFTIVALLMVFSLYLVLERKGMRARKLVATAIATPIFFFSSIFLGQTTLLLLFKGSSSGFVILNWIILFTSLGTSMFLLVLMAADAVSSSMKNFFIILYGSLFGTFLGMIMPTFTNFIVIPAVIIEDWLLISRISSTNKKLSHSGDIFRGTGVETRSASIGFGDFVIYALLAAHSLSYFPIFVWICSLSLALTGIAVNVFILAKDRNILPAIPLPAILAIAPWLVHLTTFTFFF